MYFLNFQHYLKQILFSEVISINLSLRFFTLPKIIPLLLKMRTFPDTLI